MPVGVSLYMFMCHSPPLKEKRTDILHFFLQLHHMCDIYHLFLGGVKYTIYVVPLVSESWNHMSMILILIVFHFIYARASILQLKV